MATPFFISQEDFKRFHTIDRELYTVLVIHLWRDPVESIQVMGLWLWMERSGFRHVVHKLLSFPYILVNELADEAITCLDCVNSDHFASSSSDSIDTPLMQSLIDKELSLHFFHRHRVNANLGVVKLVETVCVRALGDIMQAAVERNAAHSLAETQKRIAQSLQQSLVQSPFGFGQVRFGPADQRADHQVTPENRTMFLTFSKGYPVYEWEIREFFQKAYGDCVESLHMQEVTPNEQSLFARIVFQSPTTIELILRAVDKAKFTINGKHVWARKFVPRRPRSLLASHQPPHLPASSG